MYNFINTLVDDKSYENTKLDCYSKLIGDWYFQWIGHNKDGSTWEVPGQWHFSWILRGKAIQDNWICPRIDLKDTGRYPEGEYGTTIRFYDYKEDRIKLIFIGPNTSYMNSFYAIENDNCIIQMEIEKKKRQNKWIFKDIEENHFKWEAYTSENTGQSWELEQEVFSTRNLA